MYHGPWCQGTRIGSPTPRPILDSLFTYILLVRVLDLLVHVNMCTQIHMQQSWLTQMLIYGYPTDALI